MKLQSFPCLVKFWLLLSRGMVSKNTPVAHSDNFMTQTFRAKDYYGTNVSCSPGNVWRVEEKQTLKCTEPESSL